MRKEQMFDNDKFVDLCDAWRDTDTEYSPEWKALADFVDASCRNSAISALERVRPLFCEKAGTSYALAWDNFVDWENKKIDEAIAKLKPMEKKEGR